MIVVGSILVALPFVSRIKEQYDYRKQITKIKEYVIKISESKESCSIEFKENIVSSCTESLKLSDHIMMEELRLDYEKGIFEGEEILLVSSTKYPKQYCIGFSGSLIATGYYDGQCNNFQNP
ncbi:hypothetical protein [Geminocystis sp. GBBB08]|uniref:hypothetical protein n=1 Tax=Geminocystis sp. GBBB08 TaxID=2604140 RepID=UPI0027E24E61|nr:hypothetical protein [Geminocystis sp. GBBB08]MBL1208295.1 hypothetical protein [Geminocystis sp. GBBB08]